LEPGGEWHANHGFLLAPIFLSINSAIEVPLRPSTLASGVKRQWLVAAAAGVEPTVYGDNICGWQAECDAAAAVMHGRGLEWPHDHRVVDMQPWKNGSVVVRRTMIARDPRGNALSCEDVLCMATAKDVHLLQPSRKLASALSL
jgi:hypothetical protein